MVCASRLFFLPYFIGYQCFVLISVCRVVNAKGGRVKYICDVVKEFRRRGEEMAHYSGSIKLATSNSFSGLLSIFFSSTVLIALSDFLMVS